MIKDLLHYLHLLTSNWNISYNRYHYFIILFFSAFSKLPADVVKHLVDNPPILRQVLLYHVAQGAWFSAGLEDGASLDSLQKSKLSIKISDGMSNIQRYIRILLMLEVGNQ